ncbi:MAG TPA: sigma-70 family RNA polymerase sigma factor [Pirellulaceae bacterium]|nr:sigma-70 family RNA polymerase sigma factor [Pirellulaceae bacterium]HMO94034.1 sigma-70 family RNA polymerase sigma factor [Pirellulaceae bacterium]HMP70904.1 sigma-70 family RNA polymerase sigma factor [Pirellulaceae bacterium]
MDQQSDNQFVDEGASALASDAASIVSKAAVEMRPRLLRYVNQLLRDFELAQDVVQDALMQLHRQNPLPPENKISAWLYKVCRNRAIDVRRKENRMNAIQPHEINGQPDRIPDPMSLVLKAETIHRIDRLVESLSESQQEVLRLRFQGELSYQEIADVTGLTASNVGVTLHKAILKIRERLVNLGEL